jgi:hypothetical protein
MLTIMRDMVLPTTITGSYPRPPWFDPYGRSRDGNSGPTCSAGDLSSTMSSQMNVLFLVTAARLPVSDEE